MTGRIKFLFALLIGSSFLSAIALNLENSAEAQGASYVRQNNPVDRQSHQLVPFEITDAGTDATDAGSLYTNTSTPPLYQYPGRCAWNKGTQSPACWRDGGAAQSGWQDLAYYNPTGSDDLDWSFNDAGDYLYPADHPDAGTEGYNVRVMVGSESEPDTGKYLQVGDETGVDHGHMRVEARSGHGHFHPATISLLAGDSNNIELKLLSESTGSGDGARGQIFLNGNPAGTSTAYALFIGTGTSPQWQIGGTSVGAGNLVPIADNTYTIGRESARVNTMWARNVNGANGQALSLGNGTTQMWTISTAGLFYPEADNSYDIGSGSKRVNDIYFGGILAGGTLTFDGTDGLKIIGERFQQAKGADVASATNVTLGTDGSSWDITGNTQIDCIVNTNWQTGSVIILQFDSNPVVSHGALCGSPNTAIYLSGAANFSATADDTLMLWYDGTVWREISRTVI